MPKVTPNRSTVQPAGRGVVGPFSPYYRRALPCACAVPVPLVRHVSAPPPEAFVMGEAERVASLLDRLDRDGTAHLTVDLRTLVAAYVRDILEVPEDQVDGMVAAVLPTWRRS